MNILSATAYRIKSTNCCYIHRVTSSIYSSRYVHSTEVSDIDMTKPFAEIPRVRNPMKTLTDFARKKYSVAKFPEFIRDRILEYGEIYIEKLGFGVEKVYTANPDDWKKVFNQDARDKPTPREGVWSLDKYHQLRGLPFSLIDVEDTEWHKRKESLRSLLIPKEVTKMIPQYVDITNDFIKFLDEKLEQNELNLIENYHRFLSRWTFECAGMTVFRERFGMFGRYENIDKNMRKFYEANLNFFDLWVSLETGLPHHKVLPTNTWKAFVKILDDTFEATKDALQKSKQHLINTDVGLDDLEILVIAVDVLRGGIETISNVSLYATIELANNPRVQEKLYDELTTFVGNSEITSSTLQKLPYLRTCLKEVFRTRPLFPILSRATVNDVVLSGYHVPAGTFVTTLLGFYDKENYFADPAEFQPERWLRSNQEVNKSHPYAVLPFGHGPKSCLGRRIAENQLLLYIAKMVQHYKILPAQEKLDTVYSFFVVPDGPVNFYLEKRK